METTTAKNIKILLDLTEMTHEQLGEIAGVSRSAVSQWVRGQSVPRMSAVQRIADHFGLHKSNILDENGMSTVYRSSWDGKLSDMRSSEESAYNSAYESRQEFGEALGEIMERRGITDERLAEMINVRKDYVDSIISCKNKDLSVARAFQIADAIGISLSDIILYIEGTDVIETPDEERKSRELRRNNDALFNEFMNFLMNKANR